MLKTRTALYTGMFVVVRAVVAAVVVVTSGAVVGSAQSYPLHGHPPGQLS